jgi:wyosine [tRNA(Phe)-imidazoG37] synthetase (radical SAM superfamily)
MSFIYGPVPSRRLGWSLGVDLVPFKTCPYDCVYCQLGRTTNKTLDRTEYVPAEQVIDQLRRRLAQCARPDYIALAGSGEPTLHSRLGWTIEQIKQITDVPVAVLTNGALFYEPAVRSDCAKADLVIPSLDAGDERHFRYVNRPHNQLTLERVVAGLEQFRREYAGQIWLEVFLLAGVTAIEAEVRKICSLVERIKPDRIHLNTVVRPPAEPYAEPVAPEQLHRLCRLFGPDAEVVAEFSRTAEQPQFTTGGEEVLALLQRRPCRAQDVAAGLSIPINDAVKRLSDLVERGLVRERTRHQSRYQYYEAVRVDQDST